MGIYAIKPAFQRRLEVLRDACIRVGMSADLLTALAVILSIGGGAALSLSERNRWLLLTIPFLAMGRITLNALDGMVATATRTARPFGEVFNEVADRLSDVAWFVGLGFVINPRLSLGALVAVLLSSYAGTVAKAAGGSRLYGGVMGKADRMIAFSTFAVAAFFRWSEWVFEVLSYLVGAGALITLLQRLLTAHKTLARPHREKDAP